MANEGWRLWFAEKASPTPEAERQNRTNDPKMLSGYWRRLRVKTKHDTAIAIWTEEGADATIFQKGPAYPLNTIENADKWQEFIDKDWMHCIAVTVDDYHRALETKFWPDGKPALWMGAEEKLGLTVETGGNNPPVEESLADQIEAVAESAKALQVTDQTSADKATGLLDKLRLLLTKAEAMRIEEKAPFWQAGKDVDAKWGGIAKPGDDAKDDLEKRRKDWLRAEQRRLDAIAAAENRKREDDARAEAARIAEAENANRLAEAEAQGGTPVELVKPEEIAVPVETVAAPRAKAGTSFGRASGLKKVKKAKITDMVALITALATHPEMIAFTHTLANRAAKAGIPLAGMEIIEELE